MIMKLIKCIYFSYSLLSSSRDSTYRDEDPTGASTRQLIDEMHTNGKTVYRSFTLSRTCKPSHSTFYSAFNNNYNNNISKNHNNNNRSFVVNNPSSCTQKLQKNEIQNSVPHNPTTGFAIKKSSSCSSFLVDILFRGICPKRSKTKCILFFLFFLVYVWYFVYCSFVLVICKCLVF